MRNARTGRLHQDLHRVCQYVSVNDPMIVEECETTCRLSIVIERQPPLHLTDVGCFAASLPHGSIAGALK